MSITINSDYSATVKDSYGDTVEFAFDGTGGWEIETVDSDDGRCVSVLVSNHEVAKLLKHYADFVRHEGIAAEDNEITPTSVFNVYKDDEVASWNLAAAHAAQELKLVLNFRYAKSNTAPIEIRRLRVEGVVQTPDNEFLIVGVDPDRDDDIRNFRVDRIKGFATVSDGAVR